MYHRIKVFVIIVALFCQCRADPIKDHLFGNYFLLAVDIKSQLSLCYHDEKDGNNYGTIVGPTVFAVGYNDRFIIIAQHPENASTSTDINKVDYFILPIKSGFNWRTMNGLTGPLTKDQFTSKKHELGVPVNLTFTKEYYDLK